MNLKYLHAPIGWQYDEELDSWGKVFGSNIAFIHCDMNPTHGNFVLQLIQYEQLDDMDSIDLEYRVNDKPETLFEKGDEWLRTMNGKTVEELHQEFYSPYNKNGFWQKKTV